MMAGVGPGLREGDRSPRPAGYNLLRYPSPLNPRRPAAERPAPARRAAHTLHTLHTLHEYSECVRSRSRKPAERAAWPEPGAAAAGPRAVARALRRPPGPTPQTAVTLEVAASNREVKRRSFGMSCPGADAPSDGHAAPIRGLEGPSGTGSSCKVWALTPSPGRSSCKVWAPTPRPGASGPSTAVSGKPPSEHAPLLTPDRRQGPARAMDRRAAGKRYCQPNWRGRRGNFPPPRGGGKLGRSRRRDPADGGPGPDRSAGSTALPRCEAAG